MKANNSKNTMFAKRVATMLVAMCMGITAWGASYTISFVESGTSSDGSSNVTSKNDIISSDASDYVNSVTANSKVYNGKSGYGIKLGAGSNKGTLTINIANSYQKYPTKITFRAAQYGTDGIDLSYKINGGTAQTITLTSGTTLDNYEVNMDGETKLTSIYIAGSGDKRVYVESIKVTYTSAPMTVTFNAEGGNCATESLTEENGGDGVELPAASPSPACINEGWMFYGWATSACESAISTAPEIVGKAGDTYYPDENETLHAVYAQGEYTKEVNEITPNAKYLIVSNYSGQNYIMKSSSNDVRDYSGIKGILGAAINETSNGKYHISAINANWRYTIEGTEGNYYIRDIVNNSSSNYLDVTEEGLWGQTGYSTDKYQITVSNGEWTILNNYDSYGDTYLGFDGSDLAFFPFDAADPILLYKETTAPLFYSNPFCCDQEVTMTKGVGENATINSLSKTSVEICSGISYTQRQVTITATPAEGYELTNVSITFNRTSGTAEASYVSGPTAVGDGSYNFVYRFATDKPGAGNFSVSASPKHYTITLDGNGGEGNSENVQATHNSSALAAITNPEKTDYIFDGWYSEEGGNGNLVISKTGTLQANVEGYTGAFGIWTKGEGATLYAKWTEHTYIRYRTKCCDIEPVENVAVSSVTANSVTLSWDLPAVTTGITKMQIVNAANDVVLTDNIPVSTNGTVNGLTECTPVNLYVKAVGATCFSISSNIEAIPNGSLKVVTFNYNGANGSPASAATTCTEDEVTLGTPEEREDYIFLGWYDGETRIGGAGDSYEPEASITLTAKYSARPRYSITLKTLGQTQEVIGNKLEGSEVWPLISIKEAPALAGYEWKGWSTSEGGTVLTSSTAGTLNADKTLYAVYQKMNYKYVLVESAPSNWAGDYLIAYSSTVFADGRTGGTDGIGNQYTSANPESNLNGKEVNAAWGDTYHVTLEEISTGSNTYVLQTQDGQYNYRSSNSNGLDATNIKATAAAYPITVNNTFELCLGGNAVGAVFQYNTAGYFRYYKNGGQNAVYLYKKVGEADGAPISMLTLTVANTETVNTDELYPGGVAGNIVVEAGGKVSGSAALTVNDFTIESEAGKSGQLTSTGNVTINGDLILEIKLCEDAVLDASKYYCISAPFAVSAFEWGNGNPMVFNVDYQLFKYDGDKRARTGNGWQRVGATMEANTAYFIIFDSDNTNNQNVIRLKAANKAIPTTTSLTLDEHEATYGQTDAEKEKNSNWNGLGNPRLHYVNLNKTVSVFESSLQGFNPYPWSEHTLDGANGFVVGTAFFVKDQNESAMTFANTHYGEYRAPRRESAEEYIYCVEIAKENASRYDNRLYVMASETASTSFEGGKDLPTLNSETSNYGALIWTKNYGMRLAVEEAPMVNSKATYDLGIFAPSAGTYTISVAAPKENATLYLTKNGRIYWNLTMGACELDLAQGQNNEYGLVLRAEAPQVTTGVENGELLNGANGVQKVIIDEHVYILRGGEMYDMTGKAVK